MGCTGVNLSPPCSPHTKAKECACPILPLALPSILATALLGPANGENGFELIRDKATWAALTALLAGELAGVLGVSPLHLLKEQVLDELVLLRLEKRFFLTTRIQPSSSLAWRVLAPTGLPNLS